MANPLVPLSRWSRYTVSLLCLSQLVHGFASFEVSGSSSSGIRTPQQQHTSSVVTGANGYVGRAIVHSLLEKAEADAEANADCQGDIVCLVRAQRVEDEQAYWKAHQSSTSSKSTPSTNIRVLPYDMLDAGKSLRDALKSTAEGSARCIYHVASVFGPTDDHQQTALDNVQGTKDLVNTLADLDNCKLVLTSSMAAVRGPGQNPINDQYYTEQDWNTDSVLGANWGASYQWSKAESERRAWELCQQHNIPMVSICPSFVFGPPATYATDGGLGSSGSFSLTLVNQWIRGESPVQSRLFVDIRDVAKAHVAAGTRATAVGKRFVVSTEARVPSEEIASWLNDACRESSGVVEADKIHFDGDYAGGFIPIGQKEVETAERLQSELGVTLRPVQETMTDMTNVLLKGSKTASPSEASL
jgi:nucleoside-diphosphate-sugar epimerase